MTRIDFHSNVSDRINYACRLVRKARAANCKVVLLARDRADMMTLDQALWTFSPQDFLPHVIAGDPLAPQTPVILTDRDDVELPHNEILINLSIRTPAHIDRFQRVFEIVSTDPDELAAGRSRYRLYQQGGYPLNHHVAEQA